MNAFMTMFACISSFTSQPAYHNSSYDATIQVVCDKRAYKTAYYATIAEEGAVKNAVMSISLIDNKLVAISHVIVKRPWIAPVPLFMEVAKGKHENIVVEQIIKLYYDGQHAHSK